MAHPKFHHEWITARVNRQPQIPAEISSKVNGNPNINTRYIISNLSIVPPPPRRDPAKQNGTLREGIQQTTVCGNIFKQSLQHRLHVHIVQPDGIAPPVEYSWRAEYVSDIKQLPELHADLFSRHASPLEWSMFLWRWTKQVKNVRRDLSSKQRKRGKEAWWPQCAAPRLGYEQNQTATYYYCYFFLTLTHRYNAARGHRTGSNSCWVDDYLRRKTKKQKMIHAITETNRIPQKKNKKVRSYEIHAKRYKSRNICFFSLSTHLDSWHLYVAPVVSSTMAGHCIVTALQCSLSVSRGFVTTELVSTSLGGRIGTETGCAGCRRVKRTV